jgi:hypothetical protein
VTSPSDSKVAEAGPYRAEHGAVHHESCSGFLFTVSPPSFAEDVAKALNLQARAALQASGADQ